MAEKAETKTEEAGMTKVKVINNFHEFAGMDSNNEVEVPTHLVMTYAALGTIEMPKNFKEAK